MKTAIAAALLVLSSAAASTDFARWKAEHGVSYATSAEEAKRLAAWSANQALVEQHNAGASTFALAMNKFADLSQAEFAAIYLAPPKTIGAANTAERTFVPKSGDLPATVDWRLVNNGTVVPPVKDQEQCGSCWAFSAVAAMEGAYNYKTGTLNTFSEQELVDCVNGGKNTCALGGEMSNGIDYVASDMGGFAYTEAAYPYTGSSRHEWQPTACEASAGAGVNTTITGHTAVAVGDEAALQAASATQTVVSVGIDASLSSFQLYSSGVYAPTDCSTTDLDHGVAVVGYATMDVGGDYWIVRNSWGASWGQAGYIYMARNDDNLCGIATDACFANI